MRLQCLSLLCLLVLTTTSFAQLQTDKDLDVTLSTSSPKPSANPEISLSENSSVYAFQKRNYVDLRGIWGEKKILELSGFGILDTNEAPILSPIKGHFFRPTDSLTKIDATHLLVYTTKLNPILTEKTDPLYIEIELPDNENTLYTIYIQVENEYKDLQRILLKGHTIKGKKILNIVWDKRNYENSAVADGLYYITTKIYDGHILVGEKSQKIRLKQTYAPPINIKQNPDIHFYDLPSTSKYQSLVSEALSMGLFTDKKAVAVTRVKEQVVRKDSFETKEHISKIILLDNKDKIETIFNLNEPSHFAKVIYYNTTKETETQHYFEPDKTLTRAEFMGAIGRCLFHLGASDKNYVDLTKFSAGELLPMKDIRFIKIFINAFGIPNTPYKSLSPNSTISRAEAALLTFDLLVWRQKTIQDKLKFESQLKEKLKRRGKIKKKKSK